MQNGLMGSLGIPDAVLARARRAADDICGSAADLGATLSVDADEILTGQAGLLGFGARRAYLGGRIDTAAAHPGRLVRAHAVARRRRRDGSAASRTGRTTSRPWAVLPPRPPTATRTSSSRGPGCSTCPPLCSVKSVPRQRDSCQTGGARRELSELLVADLSSMWAGPLCGHLLAAAGATVVKVEGRAGPTARVAETRDSSTG